MGYSETVLADTPVAYWRLGEPSGTTAADEVASFDGTYTNTPTLGVAGALDGDADTAITLAAASSEHVEVAHAAGINPSGDITVECWVKFTSTATMVLVAKYGGPTDAKGWLLLADGGGVQFDGRTALGYLSSGPSGAINDGEWHQVVGRRIGAVFSIAVDGVPVNGETESAQAIDTTRVLRIGRNTDPLDETAYFDGSIDEVSLYDYALTEDRILAHYCVGRPSAGICGGHHTVGMIRQN